MPWQPPMTTASRSLASALWGARFAGVWLPSRYTTWGENDLRSPISPKVIPQNGPVQGGSALITPISRDHHRPVSGGLPSFPFTRKGSIFQLDPCLDTTGYIGKSGYMVLDQVIKCRAAPARPTSMETFRLVMNREPDAITAGEVSGLFEVPQTPHHRSGRFWQGQAL